MIPRPHSWFFAAVLVTLLLWIAPGASAQTRSTVTGTIGDGAGMALRGVAVSLASPNLASEDLAAVTDAQGVYRFPELPSGIYELTAALEGMQTVKRTGVRVPVATTLTIDIALIALAGAETPRTLTDNSPGPMVDVTTPAWTTTFSVEELENLPVIGLGNISSLVPGITRNSNFGQGNLAIQYVADNSPLTLFGTTVPLGVYRMEQAQVVGLGASAEHGEFGGVVTKVVLRSGSERFSGLLEHRTTPSSWTSDNTGGLPESLRGQFRPDEILTSWASTGQIGGPIRRGRLYFFAGFSYGKSRVIQAGRIGNIPNDFRQPSTQTKVNWVPARDIRVEGYITANRSRTTGILGVNALPETASDRILRLRSWNGRVTWTVNSRTLVEFSHGGVDLKDLNLSADRRVGPPPRRDQVSGILSGNAGGFSDRFGYRNVTGASVRQFLDGVAGRSHELRGGFELERTKLREVSGLPGNRFFTDATGIPQLVQLWDGDTSEATGTRTTLYLQDRWTLNNRISIHPGVRLSFNQASVPDKGTVSRINPVSPRVGLAWDVTNDHKTVMRASYSRVHDGWFPNLFSFMNTANLTPRVTARVLGPDTFQEINRITPAGNVAVDGNLSQSYFDEYLAGIEREIFSDASLKLLYIRRQYENLWARIDTGSQYEQLQRRDPGPDNQAGTSDDGQLVTVFNVVNPGQSFSMLTAPNGAFRRYDAVQLIGQRRFSRSWQVLAAYTWSKTRGLPPAAFVNPNNRINAEGSTAADFRHQAGVQGVYQIPIWGGVTVSGAYNYLSGSAWGRIATFTGLRQGNVNVRIEPVGTRRTDSSSQVDFRVEKTFHIASSGPTVGIYLDVFNLTNQGIAFAIIEASGGTFGTPSTWSPARSARIAGRLTF